MGRFLIFFSYLGTRYSGLQTQKKVVVKGEPILTVQDALMDALKGLRPANEIVMALSSRTDRGVHALRNSCHVDLQYPTEGKEYDPEVITNVMNFHLKKRNHDVRVLETRHVAANFNSRKHARNRKYIYRLAHKAGDSGKTANAEGGIEEYQREQALHEELKKYAERRRRVLKIRAPYGEELTSLDAYKVLFIRERLDIGKLLSAAEVLSGIHNYSSFTSPKTLADAEVHPMKMLSIGVKRGQPMGHRLQRSISGQHNDYEFWDIHIQGKSFMYKMVRRLVGAMMHHATGQMTLDELRDILDHPRHDFGLYHRMCLNEAGLFLQDVQYDPKDLQVPSIDDNQNTETEEEVGIYESELGLFSSDRNTHTCDSITEAGDRTVLSKDKRPSSSTSCSELMQSGEVLSTTDCEKSEKVEEISRERSS